MRPRISIGGCVRPLVRHAFVQKSWKWPKFAKIWIWNVYGKIIWKTHAPKFEYFHHTNKGGSRQPEKSTRSLLLAVISFSLLSPKSSATKLYRSNYDTLKKFPWILVKEIFAKVLDEIFAQAVNFAFLKVLPQTNLWSIFDSNWRLSRGVKAQVSFLPVRESIYYRASWRPRDLKFCVNVAHLHLFVHVKFHVNTAFFEAAMFK